MAPKIRMQIFTSLYASKLVKNIIANFVCAFSWLFMKSSISWDIFGKILVFCFKINDVLEIRQVLSSTVSFRWFTVPLTGWIEGRSEFVSVQPTKVSQLSPLVVVLTDSSIIMPFVMDLPSNTSQEYTLYITLNDVIIVEHSVTSTVERLYLPVPARWFICLSCCCVCSTDYNQLPPQQLMAKIAAFDFSLLHYTQTYIKSADKASAPYTVNGAWWISLTNCRFRQTHFLFQSILSFPLVGRICQTRMSDGTLNLWCLARTLIRAYSH